MKSYAAASVFVALVAAQGPPGGAGGHGGIPSGANGAWAAGFPSCVSGCPNQPSGSASFSDLCSNTTAIDELNSCVASSSCSDSDKSSVYQAVDQLCANSGVTVTASPEATFSATSGGANWPSAWSTNSAWSSVITGAPWGAGAPGWNGGAGHGPFGGGANNGWGPWASESTGSWTNGPWAKWWGTSGCPDSTWTGWTSGSWSASAPWTSWSGCTASTTATSVYTTTVTASGTTATVTTTGYGIRVAALDASGTTPSTGAAMPTNFLFAGSAAGAVGVLAGAILL